MKKTTMTFFIILFAACLMPLSSWSAPFINEIHYDNAGTDTGEAVEIAGPAGTDLTGWALLLYNGNDGAVYTTTALNGVIPNQQNGFGTRFFPYPVDAIQNGAPDGLALVNPANIVIQFLSYEGTFTAVGEAANGLLSTDIGVSETELTLIGYSLQLLGTGNDHPDFVWLPLPASFGEVNVGQNFVPVPTSFFLCSSGLGFLLIGLRRRSKK